MTMAAPTVVVTPEPLTAEAFAPFGRVVDAHRHVLHCDPGQYTARLMTLERARGRYGSLNRHPDYEQLFVPLAPHPMLLLVAPRELSGEELEARHVRAFVNDGTKAWTFGLNVWHIAPRAIDRDDAQAINVQGSRYLTLSEDCHFGEQRGTFVEVRL